MPYYVYRVESGPAAFLKHLELLKTFDKYVEARDFARQARAETGLPGEAGIKMVHAENPLQAEERLQEQRNAPILQEWEK